MANKIQCSGLHRYRRDSIAQSSSEPGSRAEFRPDENLEAALANIDLSDNRLNCKVYYKAQCRNILGETHNRTQVPIWIARDSSIRRDWLSYLKYAIQEINEAAPGLHLYQSGDAGNSKIKIYNMKNDEDEADSIDDEDCPGYCRRNILHHISADIYLSDGEWGNDMKQQTGIHEIMHGLGFAHEHTRADGSTIILCSHNDPDYDQYKKDPDVGLLTRFDPFSVMLYPESSALKRSASDKIWELKPGNDLNIELSELDKVGLNLMYRPCRSQSYNPKKSAVNGMYYCGRKVMECHDVPGGNTTDKFCGPDNWANCPACRTLKNPVVKQFIDRDKWQGMSGLVYCGKWFGRQAAGHDGYCGPDNGPPCLDCGRLLYSHYCLPSNVRSNIQFTVGSHVQHVRPTVRSNTRFTVQSNVRSKSGAW